MKVAELIRTLERNYKPDDDIVVAWWDKQLFSQYQPDTDTWIPVSARLWQQAVLLFDQGEGFSEVLNEQCWEFIDAHVEQAVQIASQEGDKQ